MAGTNFFAAGNPQIALTDESGYAVLAKCTGTPPTTAGIFQHGCLMIQTDSGNGNKAVYENVGTLDAPSWKIIAPRVASVSVTVAATATTGSSAADPTLVGGTILGVYPTGNQDQLIDNVVLNANGSVTVTLAAAATADNTFTVVVLKP